jgi:Concanavalin A-like lectin/glucanases superfamily
MPPPTTDLILQIDAGTFGGVDNDPIGTLVDQSGNSNDATNTGGNRPTFKTNIVNGLPVIRNTSGQWLETPASASLGAYTMLAVVNPSGTTGYRPIIGSRGGNGGILWDLTATTNVPRLVKTFVSNIGTGTSAVPASTFSVVAFTFVTGSSFEFFLNGTSDNSGSHSTTLTASRSINIGHSSPDTTYFAGDIAEVLIYDALLGSTELNDATAYLGTKYDIAVTGPSTYRHKPQRAWRGIAVQQNGRW